MALWQIGDRPASTVTYGSGSSEPHVIVYPNADGTTGGSTYNYVEPSKSDLGYQGQQMNINLNTGSQGSAEGLQSIGTALSGGFENLMNLIMSNTDKNNAWSAAQAQKQMDFQERMNQIAMEFNAGEAAKNRDWQEMMSNTAHQREIADLKAAGLNPVLSASGGNGAAVTSGATASGVTSSGAMADADQSGNSALASLYGAILSAQTQMYNANLSAKTNLAMAQMQQETSMYGAQLAAEASKYAAGTNYAASVYGADQSLANAREQRKWNAAHPSSAYQAAGSIIEAASSLYPKTSAGKKAASEYSVLGRIKKLFS